MIVITKQPVSFVGVAGDAAVFSVTAEGAVSYQWYYSSSEGTNWGILTWDDAKTDTMSATLNDTRTKYWYYCRLTDEDGNEVCTNMVTVVSSADIVITQQPEDVKAKAGAAVTMAVAAEGDGLTYLWKYSTNGGKTWMTSTVTGYETDQLDYNAASYRAGYKYCCVITGASGNRLISDIATLYIPQITILQQPAGVETKAGESVTMTVAAEGDGLIYQWEYNNGNSWMSSSASGNQTDTLSWVAQSYQDGYQYRCRITDSVGNTVFTDEVVLSIVPALAITKQPVSFTGVVGDTAIFSVEATGNSLAYEWQVNTGTGWHKVEMTGNTTDTLSVPVIASRDGNMYRCVITDGEGDTVITDEVKLVIVPDVGTITYATVRAIADAIKERTGKDAKLLPKDMPAAIRSIK